MLDVQEPVHDIQFVIERRNLGPLMFFFDLGTLTSWSMR